jgi:hypothetical protein
MNLEVQDGVQFYGYYGSLTFISWDTTPCNYGEISLVKLHPQGPSSCKLLSLSLWRVRLHDKCWGKASTKFLLVWGSRYIYIYVYIYYTYDKYIYIYSIIYNAPSKYIQLQIYNIQNKPELSQKNTSYQWRVQRGKSLLAQLRLRVHSPTWNDS